MSWMISRLKRMKRIQNVERSYWRSQQLAEPGRFGRLVRNGKMCPVKPAWNFSGPELICFFIISFQRWAHRLWKWEDNWDSWVQFLHFGNEAQRRKTLGFKCQYPEASWLQTNFYQSPLGHALCPISLIANKLMVLLNREIFPPLQGPGNWKIIQWPSANTKRSLTIVPSSSFWGGAKTQRDGIICPNGVMSMMN